MSEDRKEIMARIAAEARERHQRASQAQAKHLGRKIKEALTGKSEILDVGTALEVLDTNM